MFIVIADGQVVCSSDVEDVAWEASQEMEDNYEKIYVEEAYISDFGPDGKYSTTEGDCISLEDIANADQYYKDPDQCPKITSPSQE